MNIPELIGVSPTLSVWHILAGACSVFLSLWSSGHAVLWKRDPRSALWWACVTWAVPFFGPFAYYFFGINRIERKALRLRRPRRRRPHVFPVHPHTRADDKDGVSPALRHLSSLANLVGQVVRLPLTSGNSVIPLLNGDQAYPEMIRAIDAAQQSVGLCTYIFTDDRAGRPILEALCRARKRGVEVRVLIDDVGSGYAWRSVYRALEQHRVTVAYFHPTLAPWRLAYFNLRNHRKILTVDGKIGFTGGMNINESNSLALAPRHPCADIHFRLEGPVVVQIQETFQKDWYYSAEELLKGEAWFPVLEGKGPVIARGIPDGPDENFEQCRWVLLGALANARKSIRVMTPYLIPDRSLIMALNLAAMSGVRVDIVLPQASDLKVVQWASESMLWQVLERGCHVWKTPPPFDHSKMLVVDGAWCLFGSTNWDTRSLRLNFEFNIECYDEALAQQLEVLVDQRIAVGREITLKDVDSRSLPIKLRDGIARLFAPHL